MGIRHAAYGIGDQDHEQIRVRLCGSGIHYEHAKYDITRSRWRYVLFNARYDTDHCRAGAR